MRHATPYRFVGDFLPSIYVPSKPSFRRSQPFSPRRCLTPSALFALLLASAPAQAQKEPASANLITIRLEQKRGDRIDPIAPGAVFHSGDIVRFRLTSAMGGYLFVVDRGTGGATDRLFPAKGAPASGNRIEPQHSYLVPANGDGWFEVGGPPGFDLLYFLLSATPMPLPPATPSAQNSSPAPPLAPDLLPRCNDAIFKSRGECLDDSAGAAPLLPDAALPREIAPLALSASRDIILTDDGNDTSVAPSASAKLPLIYTFRLAHR